MPTIGFLPDGSRVLVVERQSTSAWVVRSICGKRKRRIVSVVLRANPSKKSKRKLG